MNVHDIVNMAWRVNVWLRFRLEELLHWIRAGRRGPRDVRCDLPGLREEPLQGPALRRRRRERWRRGSPSGG